MKKSVFIFLVFFSSAGIAQTVRLNIMGGFSNYSGDIQQKRIALSQANAVITGGATINITSKLALRGEASYTKLGADDKYNSRHSLVSRNLNFKTKIEELDVMAEYDILDMHTHPFSPYIFAGIGIYHFSPYSFDSTGKKVFLADLSTEGEGFPEYPDRKKYKRTPFNIPFGGGVKYALSEDITIGFEIGIRKLFTDYLDDVSTTYVDENVLFARKGARAVSFAFRGDEIKTNPQLYPPAGTQRGSSKNQDYYYYGQFRVSFRLNWFNNGGNGFYKRSNNGLGCPSWR